VRVFLPSFGAFAQFLSRAVVCRKTALHTLLAGAAFYYGFSVPLEANALYPTFGNQASAEPKKPKEVASFAVGILAVAHNSMQRPASV
jgi:hypothetical protein